MNIAINTLTVTPQRAGSKTYLVNLIKNLAGVDTKNTYFLFVSSLNKTLFQRLGKNFKIIMFPLRSDNQFLRFFYEQFIIPYYVRKQNITVLLSPSNIAGLFSHCRQVLTFHAPLMIRKLRKNYAPKEVSKLQSLLYEIFLPLSVRRADKIIAVSKNTRQWLLKQTNIAASKVKVIYEGVDCDLFQLTHNVKTLNIDKPYLLFLSTLFCYKNADNLIRAFSKLKKTHKIPHRLIIAGRDTKNRTAQLRHLAESEGVSNDIVFTGSVPHEKVADLYQNSDLFVFPSAVETFGLPVLEAMACGTPVVASNRTSVPEIVGDAGIIIDPDDINELSEAILRVLSDKVLRKKLIQKGYQRVKEFSWEKTARETLKVFKKVLNES